MIEITSPSRLHLSLIDLNASLGRVDGGVGVSLQYPHIHLTAEKSDQVEITGSSLLYDKVRAAISALLPEGEGISIYLDEDMPAHIGLGSGTQVTLCTAAAINELFELGLSVRHLAQKVGRGGTSGIGVAAFEEGGFLVDCGHRFSDKGAFSPSSASPAPPAPVVFRHDFPDWPIVLALPDRQGAHDAQEVDIFRQVCPVPLEDVQTISHIVLMQMIPAVIENDIENFGSALDSLQTLGFKKQEISLQSQQVQDVIEQMRMAGTHGVGMSSFGPAICGFVENENQGKRIVRQMQKYLDENIGGKVLLTTPNNTGADIRMD